MNKITLAQMCSTSDIEHNLRHMMEAFDTAVSNGASLVAYPENCLYLGRIDTYLSQHHSLVQSAIQSLQNAAATRGVSVLLGSVFEVCPHVEGKFYNTTLFINDTGEITQKYQKIHLFDADIPNARLQESTHIERGKTLKVFQHQGICIGLTICYDLRFPCLFQRLGLLGADIIFVPAAFTVPTGEAHWSTLLRARAIENQVYIAAPAQYGRHSDTRESYGKSLFIDPWGKILAVAEDGTGLISAEIDIRLIRKIRKQMPIVDHRAKGIDTFLE